MKIKTGIGRVKAAWANSGLIAKQIMFVIAFVGATTPGWVKLKNYVDDNLLWYFKATDAMVKQWRVRNGIDEALLDRINAGKEYFVVFSDGVKRSAVLFQTAEGEAFVFIDDSILGNIVYAAYYNESRTLWYFYSFEDDPYTIIYEK